MIRQFNEKSGKPLDTATVESSQASSRLSSSSDSSLEIVPEQPENFPNTARRLIGVVLEGGVVVVDRHCQHQIL